MYEALIQPPPWRCNVAAGNGRHKLQKKQRRHKKKVEKKNSGRTDGCNREEKSEVGVVSKFSGTFIFFVSRSLRLLLPVYVLFVGVPRMCLRASWGALTGWRRSS